MLLAFLYTFLFVIPLLSDCIFASSPLLESLQIIPGPVAPVSCWDPHSLGLQTPGMVQQGRMDIVLTA